MVQFHSRATPLQTVLKMAPKVIEVTQFSSPIVKITPHVRVEVYTTDALGMRRGVNIVQSCQVAGPAVHHNVSEHGWLLWLHHNVSFGSVDLLEMKELAQEVTHAT